LLLLSSQPETWPTLALTLAVTAVGIVALVAGRQPAKEST